MTDLMRLPALLNNSPEDVGGGDSRLGAASIPSFGADLPAPGQEGAVPGLGSRGHKSSNSQSSVSSIASSNHSQPYSGLHSRNSSYSTHSESPPTPPPTTSTFDHRTSPTKALNLEPSGNNSLYLATGTQLPAATPVPISISIPTSAQTSQIIPTSTATSSTQISPSTQHSSGSGTSNNTTTTSSSSVDAMADMADPVGAIDDHQAGGDSQQLQHQAQAAQRFLSHHNRPIDLTSDERAESPTDAVMPMRRRAMQGGLAGESDR